MLDRACSKVVMAILAATLPVAAWAAAPVSGLSLTFPVPSAPSGYPSQDYAAFNDASANRHHAGLDIAAPVGTPVVAAAAGRVSLRTLAANSNKTRCMGNVVMITHSAKVTLYAHLQSVSVSEGQNVSQGQQIGTVGTTTGLTQQDTACASIGAHLHFELKNNAVLATATDSTLQTWGYTPPIGVSGSATPSHQPDAYGYFDPVLNLHTGIRAITPVTVAVTSSGGGVSLRTGPATTYRGIGSTTSVNQQFTAIAERPSSTTNCSAGWYQVTRVGGAYFSDTAAGSGASVPEAWVCKGNSGQTWVDVVGDTTAPTTPSTLLGSPVGPTAVALAWTASTDSGGSGLAGYKVERCTGSGCTSFIQIATPTINNHGDTGRSANTTYRYRVRAYDGAGNNSSYSNTVSVTTDPEGDTTAPTVPQALTASPASESQIDLTWGASTDSGGSGLAGYRLERCTGGSCSSFTQIAETSAISHSDTGRSANTTYSYRVRSYDNAGNASGPSNVATANTPGGGGDTTPPTTPSTLSASPASESAISLSWGASTDSGSGLAGYKVERCAGSGCTNFAQVGTSTASLVQDDGLLAGTTYRYRVRAYDNAGNHSAFSPIASATTLANTAGDAQVLWRNTSTGAVFRMFVDGASVTGGVIAYQEPNLAWKIVAAGDVNGDGIPDAVWRNEANGQVYVMTFAASGMPSGGAIVHVEPNAAWKIVHMPDLDGDGMSDLLWWNSSTGQVYAMLLNGASVKAQGMAYTESNTAWRIAAVGAFAGGTSQRLLWRNIVTGQVYLQTVNHAGGGAFSQTGQMIYTEPNNAWKIVGAPDLDGDGRADILWRHETGGQVFAMLMNGPAIVAQAMVHAEPDTAWKVVAFIDADGDGRDDLLWRNESSGHVYLMRMNGTSIAAQGMLYVEPNTAWKILGEREFAVANGGP